MGLKCGIIGMPNVGKSTLFNVLTKSQVAAKNFPFCTIKPNIGIVPVFDVRLNKIAELVSPNTVTPTYIEFIDIAGLVKGASKGVGLGNLFLSDIHQADVIFHVVRCFFDDNIVHMHSKIDPIADVESIHQELILSDFQVCTKELIRIKGSSNIKEFYNQKKISLIEYFLSYLKEKKLLRNLKLTLEELKLIGYLNLLTLKPLIYIANISDNRKNTVSLSELSELASIENTVIIPICILHEYQNYNQNIKKNYVLKVLPKNMSDLHLAVKKGYDLLQLQTFFTVGKKEVRAWSIKKGTNSLQAARKIHTDLQKGFIRAKVISYENFIKYKELNKIRELGKLRFEGKEYILQDGDIVHFLFNV
ncbi:redox-regulated ATPase YchF [Buchnera aphidicola]|uniref:redox-regulated ATPase YchF n=1 Tax=Buchnera aphidicola TaxID=9 RepID=UPI00346448E9